MLTIHEIGEYQVRSDLVLSFYMVEHQGGQTGFGRIAPAVTYCMDVNGQSEILFYPDWLAFAHLVNSKAGKTIFHPQGFSPAEKAGIIVAAGFGCPNCGNRMTDFLPWIEAEGGRELIRCACCAEIYYPGDSA